jgi:hypothetical protein
MQSKKNWTVWRLKVGLVGCPETSVTNYQPTPRNIPENRKSRFVRLFADLQIFHSNNIIEVCACYQMKGTLETAHFRNIEFWGTRSTYWHTEVVDMNLSEVHIPTFILYSVKPPNEQRRPSMLYVTSLLISQDIHYCLFLVTLPLGQMAVLK